jgi:hypothetical protein
MFHHDNKGSQGIKATLRPLNLPFRVSLVVQAEAEGMLDIWIGYELPLTGILLGFAPFK